MAEDDVASSCSSSPPAPAVAFRHRWDVFLSFRGEDTRESFTKSLYETLEREGVRAFQDDDGLNRGDEIAPSLLEAIEDSAAAVVVVSPRYGDSRWCLEKLTKICECRRLILPVFYRVDPSDVRRQRGPFEENFRSHEERFGEDKVSRWRRAMNMVGGIAGWVFKHGEEAQLIQSIVKKVLAKIKTTPVGLAEYTVGLDSRVEKLTNMLDIKSNGVKVLGLHGIGGVGKTTLATALFNKLLPRFQLRSFIPNIRSETSSSDDQSGLLSLQNKLITDLSQGDKDPPVSEINAGISKLNMKVNEQRVLIVLDDVDSVEQVLSLVPKKEWFYDGSRVIITARNKEVFPVDRVVTELYEVRELEFSESLNLFSYHALGRGSPQEEFYKLSEKIVEITGGLPLALEVFGSFLFGKRRREEWEDAVNKLARIRPGNLQDVLRISFDGLHDDQVKCAFLDVACLFVQMRMQREEVVDVLKGCGFPAETAIADLVAKSLVKIAEDRKLWMHDQVRDMGRQIVVEENISYPGMRSRVWDREEIMKAILTDEKEAKSTQGMVLDFEKKDKGKALSVKMISWENFWENPSFTSLVTYIMQIVKGIFRFRNRREKEEEIIISTKPIETMAKLRLLQINHVNLQGKFSSLPSGLKWLQWKGCPLESLPSDLNAPQLAVLDLSESKIERLWGYKNMIFSWIYRPFEKNKVAENLVILNLCKCYRIASIPDMSHLQKLEKLILEHCTKLTEVHDSIGNMQTLIYLNLCGCTDLIKIPNDVSGLKRLEKLILSHCSKLEKLPENMGTMNSLKKLLVDDTAIAGLPESTFHLTRLEELDLSRCTRLNRLPQFIGKLCSLKELSLNGSALEEFPDSIGSLANLEKLSVMWCPSLKVIPDSIGKLKSLTQISILSSPISELPVSVGLLPNLQELSVGRGQFLTRIPDSIEGLNSLVVLEIEQTKITGLPDQIGALKLLEKLVMRKCKSLVSLPESIGSLRRLTILIISEAKLTNLPESIGNLESLAMLNLRNCRELRELPESIGNLKSLHKLLMEDTRVAKLPESFGMLTSLIFLKMTKKSLEELPSKRRNDIDVLPTSFSSLSLLNEFYARYCDISGKIPDDFEKLSSLEILDLGYNHFCSLPSSLKGMSILKKLTLPNCQELKSLPPLPSSLLEINVANCVELETVSDISNLESLQLLNLANCEKVVDIPGLECLKSLTRLYLNNCNSCSSAVRKRLARGSLRNMRNLSMPGSKIPNWLSQDAVVTFSECRNHALKAVIIGVVVSLNHQIHCENRNHIPTVVDILAKVLKLDGSPVCTTTLYLLGVPNTNHDQFHLCRFSVHDPLVLWLKDGYKIEVTKRNPAYDLGVEMKKCGIHFVYEGDDDYEGDEESLNESQLSTSEKLAKFFGSYEEDDRDHVSESSAATD